MSWLGTIGAKAEENTTPSLRDRAALKLGIKQKVNRQKDLEQSGSREESSRHIYQLMSVALFCAFLVLLGVWSTARSAWLKVYSQGQ